MICYTHDRTIAVLRSIVCDNLGVEKLILYTPGDGMDFQYVFHTCRPMVLRGKQTGGIETHYLMILNYNCTKQRLCLCTFHNRPISIILILNYFCNTYNLVGVHFGTCSKLC